MNFSDKIKFQREQNHLTQKELAELVGVSQRAIAAYESSGTIARISTMRKLAHAYQIPITRCMSKKRAEYEDFSSWKHQETMIFEIENFRQNCIINLK